jgi:AhpD family alkylhydroperoxidase
MLNDWAGMTRDYSTMLREVRAGIPEVMKGFSMTAQAALKANALDTKTKELLALGIGVATRCDPCIAFHAEAAVKQGASREEILETIGIAIYNRHRHLHGRGSKRDVCGQGAGGLRPVRASVDGALRRAKCDRT